MSNPVLTGMKRGIVMRCPECGKGKLFRAYLKVDPTCDACGHDNSQYKADDGPAYLTIVLVGHLVIAPLLAFEFVGRGNPILVLALLIPVLALITLATLPFVKGAFLGLMWALGLRGQHR
jgi:uncharacterized protein (DUF983 family)